MPKPISCVESVSIVDQRKPLLGDGVSSLGGGLPDGIIAVAFPVPAFLRIRLNLEKSFFTGSQEWILNWNSDPYASTLPVYNQSADEKIWDVGCIIIRRPMSPHLGLVYSNKIKNCTMNSPTPLPHRLIDAEYIRYILILIMIVIIISIIIIYFNLKKWKDRICQASPAGTYKVKTTTVGLQLWRVIIRLVVALSNNPNIETWIWIRHPFSFTRKPTPRICPVVVD